MRRGKGQSDAYNGVKTCNTAPLATKEGECYTRVMLKPARGVFPYALISGKQPNHHIHRKRQGCSMQTYVNGCYHLLDGAIG